MDFVATESISPEWDLLIFLYFGFVPPPPLALALALGKEVGGEEVFVNRTGGTWLVAVGRATVPACGVAGCPAPIRTTAWVVSTHHQSVTGLEAPARTSFHARFGSCAVQCTVVQCPPSPLLGRACTQLLYDLFLCCLLMQ